MISASDLLAFQNTVNSTLPDTATIERTGAVIPVRVLPDRHRLVRLPGLPPSVQLQEWQFTLPYGTDLKLRDQITVAGESNYYVTEMENWSSQSPSVRAYGFAVGAGITCSTLRQPGAMNAGTTAAMTTHLAALTIWPLANVTIYPASPDWVGDAFGVQLEQPGVILADWPLGNTEDAPVGPNDIIVFPGGIQYAVAGVQGWSGAYIAITIEMALS